MAMVACSSDLDTDVYESWRSMYLPTIAMVVTALSCSWLLGRGVHADRASPPEVSGARAWPHRATDDVSAPRNHFGPARHEVGEKPARGRRELEALCQLGHEALALQKQRNAIERLGVRHAEHLPVLDVAKVGDLGLDAGLQVAPAPAQHLRARDPRTAGPAAAMSVARPRARAPVACARDAPRPGTGPGRGGRARTPALACSFARCFHRPWARATPAADGTSQPAKPRWPTPTRP